MFSVLIALQIGPVPTRNRARSGDADQAECLVSEKVCSEKAMRAHWLVSLKKNSIEYVVWGAHFPWSGPYHHPDKKSDVLRGYAL